MASLQYIQSSTLQSVTLGSAYTAGSGTMTLTAGNGAYLPSSGDFWLSYNNGAGVVRLFKVTARSTDTLTVTAVSGEGSGDGNISSGETLRWALTYDALNQLRLDICGYGTYANLPATCVIGSQYYTSDSPYNFVATATNTWTPFHENQVVTIPPSSGWSWVNQGTSTIDTTSGDLVLTAQAATAENLRIYARSTPAAPYTITWKFRTFNLSNTAGIGFRESGTGELVILAFTPAADPGVYKYNSATNFNTTVSTFVSVRTGGQSIWARQRDDNTNRYFDVSVDGNVWINLYSEARTTFLTADQVFFYANPNSASVTNQIQILSYKES